MVVVDSASFAPDEAPDLQNVEFFSTNGSIVTSWLESGNSNTATSTVYWLNLASGIPADSSITVYMGFSSTSTNLFNGQTVGEAPELSTPYGSYDNGQNLFNFYDNFKGSALNTALWTNYASAGIAGSTAGLLVNNGLTIKQNSGFVSGESWLGTSSPQAAFSGPLVADFYSKTDVQGVGKTNARMGFEDTLPNNYGQGNGFGFQGGSNDAELWDYQTVTAGTYSLNPSTNSEIPPINTLQVYTVSATAGQVGFSINYITLASGTITTDVPAYSSSIGLFMTNNYQPTDNFYQWVRVRAYPPDGVMPSVIVNGVSTSFSTSQPLANALNSCPANGTVSTRTILTSDLFCPQLTITSGVTLTTNGFSVIVSGSLVNDGEILAGYPNNGGLVSGGAGKSYPSSYAGSGGGGGYNAGGGGAGGSTLVPGGAGGVAGIGGGPGKIGETPSVPAMTNALIESMYSDGIANYLSGGGGGAGQSGAGESPQGNGGSGSYGIYMQANQFVNNGQINASGQAGIGSPSGPNNGGGGGGGGGAVLIAYGNGGETMGKISFGDGPGGLAASPGGAGGDGQLVSYSYGSNPPNFTTGSGQRFSSSSSSSIPAISPQTINPSTSQSSGGVSSSNEVVYAAIGGIAIVAVLGVLMMRRRGKRTEKPKPVTAPAPKPIPEPTKAKTEAKTPQTSLSPEAIARLERLKRMLDDGLITQAEYEDQKKRLMGG